MIIFGSRMYGKKNLVRGVGACGHCGVYGAHRSYEGRKFGHLYFIPLIPAGGAVRVMKECAACKMGQHMPVGKVASLYARIEALMQPCILAAGEGRRSFTDPESGEESHNGPFLLDAVDLMVTAGFGGEVPGILGLLDNDAARYEHQLATGAWHEIRGEAGAAVKAFTSAAQAAPDEPLPNLLLSEFFSRAGRHEDALYAIERAQRMLPEDVRPARQGGPARSAGPLPRAGGDVGRGAGACPGPGPG